MSSLTFYDILKMRSFDRGQAGRDNLQAVMHELHASTSVTEPNSPRELTLDYVTGRTHTGYRYTSEGFSRVCKATATHLSRVVEHIAGVARQLGRVSENPGLSSFADATAMLNIAINRRFLDWLSNYRVVYNLQTQTIDGLLGPRTRFIANLEFVELVEATMGMGYEFAGATMAGRRLFVRYASQEGWDTQLGHIRRGLAFCAAEAGDDALRAYQFYELPDGKGFLNSVARPQKRTGKRFKQHLQEMLQRTYGTEPPDISRAVDASADARIFTDLSAVDRSVSFWRRKLKLAHVPSQIADRVTARLVLPDDAGAAPFTDDQLRAKTEMDILLGLLDESTRVRQAVREILERAAFNVFLSEE